MKFRGILFNLNGKQWKSSRYRLIHVGVMKVDAKIFYAFKCVRFGKLGLPIIDLDIPSSRLRDRFDEKDLLGSVFQNMCILVELM